MVRKIPRDPTRLKIKDFVITDEFTTIPEDTIVKDAIQKLLDMKRGVLLIKVGDDVKGVLTERKMLKGMLDVLENPLDVEVSKIMDTHIMYVRENTDLETALEMIKKEKPSAVIVNDNEGNFKGYFSPIDYIEAENRLRELKEMKDEEK